MGVLHKVLGFLSDVFRELADEFIVAPISKASNYVSNTERVYEVFPERRLRNNPDAQSYLTTFIFIVLFAVSLVIASACLNYSPYTLAYPDGDSSQTAEKGIGQEIILQFTGDILCHDGQIKDAEVTKNHFIFDRSYTEIRDIISAADLSITTFDGVISTDEQGYSGHPDYFTPIEFVRAASTAGTDVISINTEGIDNSGKEGIGFSQEKIDGVAETLWNEPIIKDIEGIRVGIVPVLDAEMTSNDMGYNLFDRPDLRKDVKYCEANNTDFLIAYVRWTEETGYVPTEEMRNKAKYLISIGFDMVIGGGNRSIMPSEYITTDRYGNPGETRTGTVFYSLGNMLSNQRTSLGDIGAIVNLRLRKISSEKTKLVGYEVIPTYTNVDLANGRNFKIVPVYKDQIAPDWMDDYNKNRYSEVYQIVETMIENIS